MSPAGRVTPYSVNGASSLKGAVSREGRRYSQLSLELSGDKPYLVMGLFEGSKPKQGAGSNALAMRSKAGGGVNAFLKVSPAVREEKRATGTFEGVLVVTNRKSQTGFGAHLPAHPGSLQPGGPWKMKRTFCGQDGSRSVSAIGASGPFLRAACARPSVLSSRCASFFAAPCTA